MGFANTKVMRDSQTAASDNRVSGIAIAANAGLPIDVCYGADGNVASESCTWPKDAIVLVFGFLRSQRVGNSAAGV